MSKPKTKKRVVFSIGGKGGVGKSWLICLLIDWYLSKEIVFHSIDLDNENNTLSRFYPEAEFIEVSKERDLDTMIEKIVEGEIALTVIDMRAASTDRIEPWLRKVDFDALEQEHGIWFTAIGVVDSSTDSVSNIGYWAKDVLGSRKGTKFIIALNKVRGEELSYPTSKEAVEYRKNLDLIEIELPKLDEWVHQKLEVADLRVGTALDITEPSSPLTKFMTKSRLKRYQQAVFAEFEKAKDRLLP
jgi:CO dehydrogenase nickel-insertion accessory protein CooC1